MASQKSKLVSQKKPPNYLWNHNFQGSCASWKKIELSLKWWYSRILRRPKSNRLRMALCHPPVLQSHGVCAPWQLTGEAPVSWDAPGTVWLPKKTCKTGHIRHGTGLIFRLNQTSSDYGFSVSWPICQCRCDVSRSKMWSTAFSRRQRRSSLEAEPAKLPFAAFEQGFQVH